MALFLSLAAVATVQRGVLTRSHATFPIFRQSFIHLRAGQDLYARYPAEQGSEDRDRFKYSPTAALFFAPFALLPFVAGPAIAVIDRLYDAKDLYRSGTCDRGSPRYSFCINSASSASAG